MVNTASYIHRERSAPDRAEARAWVAEVDGRAVGRVECFRNFFTGGSRNGFLNVAVQNAHRNRGLGVRCTRWGSSTRMASSSGKC